MISIFGSNFCTSGEPDAAAVRSSLGARSRLPDLSDLAQRGRHASESRTVGLNPLHRHAALRNRFLLHAWFGASGRVHRECTGFVYDYRTDQCNRAQHGRNQRTGRYVCDLRIRHGARRHTSQQQRLHVESRPEGPRHLHCQCRRSGQRRHPQFDLWAGRTIQPGRFARRGRRLGLHPDLHDGPRHSGQHGFRFDR